MVEILEGSSLKPQEVEVFLQNPSEKTVRGGGHMHCP